MIEYWLKLLAFRGLSVNQKRTLIEKSGSIEALFTLPVREIEQILNGQQQCIRNISWNKFRHADASLASDLSILLKYGIDYIPFNSPDFPPLLNQIPEPPLGLFVRGSVDLLLSPQLSIVGSRSPSPSGLNTARDFAHELSQIGLTITSGLALGIDTAAHRGALDADRPTIAVMATGADQIYPASNRRLGETIAERGLLVTEFPPNTAPKRQHFPRRNRLISGLSLGTLIVEAGIRSGSLITARLAAEQNREVFAIPSSIHLPTSRGCHYLIRQGARLVETTQDIIDEIGHYFTQHKPIQQVLHNTPPINPEASMLLKLIDYAPTSIDKIIIESGLAPERVTAILTDLELSGRVAAMPGGGFQRIT